MARRKLQNQDLDFTKISPVKPAEADTESLEDLAPAEHLEPHQIASVISGGLAPDALEQPDFDTDALTNALKHSSAPAQLLESAYDRFFPKGEQDEYGNSSPDGHFASEMIDAIVSNPNTPADVIERHLARTYQHEDENGGVAWDHPTVQEAHVRQLAQNLAGRDSGSVYSFPERMQHLHPDFYHELLGQRPIPEPETDTMTEAQKRINTRVGNTDKLFLSGLARTKHHTPETLQRAVDFYLGEKPYGMKGVSRSIGEFVENQPNLSSEQIDRLYDASLPARHDDYGSAAKAILTHPNVSPATLARAALTKKGGPASAENKMREVAIKSPKLPEATRRKLVKQTAASEKPYWGSEPIFENPALDAEDLKTLYASGRESPAIKHHNAPPEMLSEFYEKHKEDLDSMRSLLASSASIPKDVLKDLVNHKKQELAVAALQRPEADMDVVNEGLKRKAATVRQAAMRNPLVASRALMEGLRDGRMPAFDFLQPNNVQALGGKVPDEAARLISDQHSMDKYDRGTDQAGDYEGKQKFWAVKQYLATHDGIPADIKAQHTKDIADHFLKITKLDDTTQGADSRSDIKSQLGSDLITMADDGNPEAREALLHRPNYLRHTDLSDPSFGNEYLKRAAIALSTGQETTRGLQNSLRDIARNPNLDQETFDRITLDPKFLSEKELYGGQETWSNNKERGETIFDQRYAKATPEERQVGFGKLMETAEGQKALLNSKTAPPDMWRAAFEALPEPARDKLLSRIDVSKYGDEQTYNEALVGEHNYDRAERRRSVYGTASPQVDALKGLNLAFSDDRALLQQSMSDIVSNTLAGRGESFGQIAAAINMRGLSPEHVSEIVRSAYNADPEFHLGSLIALHAADQMSGPREEKLASLIRNMNDLGGAVIAGANPQAADQILSARWRSLLSNMGNTTSEYGSSTIGTMLQSMVGASRKSRYRGDTDGNAAIDGSLDFLADLPDDGLMTEKAVEYGLLSPAKIAQVGESSPERLATGMKRMDHAMRAKVLGDMVDNGQVNMATIPHLIPILNSGIFTSKGYGTAFNEQMYGDTKGRVFQFADAVAASDPARAAEAIANTVGRDPEERSNRMPIDFKKRLVKDYVDHVMSSNVPETSKYLTLGNLYGSLKDNGAAEFMPAKLQKHMADEATKSGNVPAIAAMIASGNASDEMVKKAADMFTSPDNLSAEHMDALSRILSGPLPNEDRRKVFDGIVHKLGTMGPEDERYRIGLAKRACLAAEKTLESTNISSEQVSHFGNIMAAFSRSENQEVAKVASAAMITAIQNNAVPVDQRASLFAAVPDEHVNEHALLGFGGSSQSTAFVNHQTTLEAAVTPNKLNAIMRTASALMQEQVDTVTARALRMLEAGEIDEHSAMMNFSWQLMDNPHATSDQAVKVFRALNWPSQLDAFTNGNNGRNRAASHAAATILMDGIQSVLDHQGGALDGSITNPATPSHVASAAIRLRSISASMGEMLQDISLANESQSKEGAIRLLNQIKQFGELAVKSAKTGITDGPHPNDKPLSYAQQLVKDAPEGYFSNEDLETFLQIGQHNDDLRIHYAEAGKEDMNTGRLDIADVIPEEIHRFHLSDEHVDGLLKRRPEIVYALAKRPRVSHETFMRMDVDAMFKYDKEFGETLADMMGKVPLQKETAGPVIDKVLSVYRGQNDFTNLHLENLFSGMIQRSPGAFDAQSIDRIAKAFKDKSAHGHAYSPKTAIKTVKMAAAKHGSLDARYVHGMLKDRKKLGLTEDDVVDLARHAHVDSKVMDELVDAAGTENFEHAIDKMSQNERVTADVVDRLVQSLDQIREKDEYSAREIGERLTKNPSISPESLTSLYESTKDRYSTGFEVGQKFHPAFLNPRHGGDLFRSLPVTVPKSLKGYGLSDAKLVKTAEYSQARSRLKQAMAAIPPQGIDWATFKRANPRMESWPEVKSMFMAKNNKPLMPEDAAEAIRRSEANEFHVTYTTWKGAQRHRGGSGNEKSDNLVIQLNTSKPMEEKMAANPKLLAFFQFVQQSANGTSDANVGGHPVTPHIASWVRVDVGGGKNGWIIEEQQSDFSQRLHDEIDSVAKQHPDGLHIGEHLVTPEEMHQFNDEIAEIVKGWYQAGFDAAEKLARNHGVKALYLHGPEPRAQLSGYDPKKPYPPYFREMYDKYPRSNGWEETSYDSYPVKSQSFSEQLEQRANKRCWVKKLK